MKEEDLQNNQLNENNNNIDENNEEIDHSEETQIEQKEGFIKIPSKYKLIIIGSIIFAAIPIILIVCLFAPTLPVMSDEYDGAFDGTNNDSQNSSIGTQGSNTGSEYTEVSKGTSGYYYPVGSTEITTVDGKKFASGTPVETTSTENNNAIIITPTSGSNGEINVVAVKDGKVISTNNLCKSGTIADNCGDNLGYGNYVRIKHNDGSETLYGYLHENTITVKNEDTVKRGQVIGKIGSSGNATQTGLYFEMLINGSNVNPNNYLSVDKPRPKDSITYVSGKDVLQTVCLSLKATGFPDNGIAAIVTNIYYECSFNIDDISEDDESIGLFQWTGDRKNELIALYPNSYFEVESQLNFFYKEITKTYTKTYAIVNEPTQSAEYGADYFCKDYERPACKSHNCPIRGKNADGFLDYVKNGCSGKWIVPPAGQQTMKCSSQ